MRYKKINKVRKWIADTGSQREPRRLQEKKKKTKKERSLRAPALLSLPFGVECGVPHAHASLEVEKNLRRDFLCKIKQDFPNVISTFNSFMKKVHTGPGFQLL